MRLKRKIKLRHACSSHKRDIFRIDQKLLMRDWRGSHDFQFCFVSAVTAIARIDTPSALDRVAPYQLVNQSSATFASSRLEAAIGASLRVNPRRVAVSSRGVTYQPVSTSREGSAGPDQAGEVIAMRCIAPGASFEPRDCWCDRATRATIADGYVSRQCLEERGPQPTGLRSSSCLLDHEQERDGESAYGGQQDVVAPAGGISNHKCLDN